MAICNLFKKLTKPTGNFMMFSQYTEDLTKATTSPEFYRVIPSKFVVMDVNYNTELLNIYKYRDNLNIAFPLYLQDAFENGCALMRELINENTINSNIQLDLASNIHWSENIFWNSMLRAELLNIDKDKIIKNIHYIGDINLLSYNEYEGMGYNEIYCFIPAESIKLKYNGELIGISKIISTNDKQFIEGFTKDIINNSEWSVKLKENPTNYDYGSHLNLEKQNDISENFNFNTIIILYDVRVKDKETGEIVTIKLNIPMGVYLTGTINPDGTVTNSKTKYISRSELYDSGTSYGLRLCSRFISSPNSDSLKITDITTENTSYSLYCQLMTKMAETLMKMDEILKQLHIEDVKYKELYSLFKNSRTNVPYIKEINGVSYWFVNGRKLDAIASTTI